MLTLNNRLEVRIDVAAQKVTKPNTVLLVNALPSEDVDAFLQGKLSFVEHERVYDLLEEKVGNLEEVIRAAKAE